MNYSLYKILRSDRPNRNGLCPLYLRYTFNRKYYNIPTELTLNPENWDNEHNEFQPTFRNRNNYTLLISKKEIEVRKVVDNFKIHNDNYPTHIELKNILNNFTQPRKTLKNYFDGFVEYKTQKKVEKSTLTVYNTTWKIWEEFQLAENKVFELKEMNYSTFDKFQSYCEGLGKQNNTIGKYIKTLKTFLHYTETFHKVILSHDLKNVKKPSNQSDFEIFTRKELETLKSSVFISHREVYKDHGLTEQEIQVGQMMMFLCSTGLSFVDFNKLTVNDLVFDTSDYDGQNGCYIKLTRTKLKRQEMCVIPIIDITIELILLNVGFPFTTKITRHRPIQFMQLKEKIKYLKSWLMKLKDDEERRIVLPIYPRIFPSITNQVFNRTIKDVCQKLEINDPIKVSVKRYNRIEEITVPKYKRISSHSGRRTFITQQLEQGVRMEVVMKMTGQKKWDTMKKYTKITDKTVNSEVIDKVRP